VGRRSIKRGPSKRHIKGKDFHLADEIRYIQRRAAEHAGRFVTVGSLALFSTDTGDAWLLDPHDHLARRLARDGDPEQIYFEETDTTLPSAGKGNIELMETRSSTSIRSQAESSPSLDTRSTALRNGADWKFQICLASIVTGISCNNPIC
jgi:hypothetical protein